MTFIQVPTPTQYTYLTSQRKVWITIRSDQYKDLGNKDRDTKLVVWPQSCQRDEQHRSVTIKRDKPRCDLTTLDISAQRSKSVSIIDHLNVHSIRRRTSLL